MIVRMRSLFHRLFKHRRKIEQAEFEVYEPGMNVDESKLVLFNNQDEVEYYKLEQEIRVLDAKIEDINKTLIPRQEEYRRKHKNLWNY